MARGGSRGDGGDVRVDPDSNRFVPSHLRGQFPGQVGFFEKTVNTGKDKEKKLSPQEQAAAAIQKGLDTATETIETGVDTARSDLQPFTDAGTTGLDSVQRNLSEIETLITDPTAQNEFVTNNPFFTALADDAQRRIFNNQASRGKVGSGGTAEALQNSLLLLGPDLVNQNISQRSNLAGQNFNLANLGLTSAGGQATSSAAGALTLADLSARGGETQAAGILGVENTRRQDKSDKRSDLFGLAGTALSAFALSDRRMKTDILPLGNIGFPVYLFKYKGSDRLEIGTMAQDVEHTGAVINVAGTKFVDYARL